MARENTTEMAVLGLLALGAKTGYDVRQACEEHEEVFSMGVAGWWPDMGDPLDADAKLARHYTYRAGPLASRPGERPWSLHRAGFAGMQKFGGWTWSGDVASSWETLAGHVPVGINASLSSTTSAKPAHAGNRSRSSSVTIIPRTNT